MSSWTASRSVIFISLKLDLFVNLMKTGVRGPAFFREPRGESDKLSMYGRLLGEGGGCDQN